MMARDQFVMDRRTREVTVVTAHAHHLLFVGHRVGGERHLDHFAAKEKRADELSLGRHHLHAPAFACEIRDGDEVVVFDELDRFEGEFANHFRLFTGFDVEVLDVFEGLVPVVAEAEFARCSFHLRLAPDHLLFADGDDLFRCVRDHFGTQLADQRFASDRIADDIARVAGSGCVSAGTLKTTTAASALPAWTTWGAALSCLWAVGTNTDDPFSNKIRIICKRLIQRPVRLFVPPREYRIVAVVKRVPISKIATQIVDGGDCAIRYTFLGPRGFALDGATSFVNLLPEFVQRRSHLRRVDAFHATTRFFQIDDRLRKRDHRLDLSELFGLNVELSQFVFEVISEEDVVDLAVLAHRVEVERLQGSE